MSAIRTIISNWGTTEDFAVAIGVKTSTAHKWVVRRAIPPRWWPKIIASAEEQNLTSVTWEALAKTAPPTDARDAA